MTEDPISSDSTPKRLLAPRDPDGVLAGVDGVSARLGAGAFELIGASRIGRGHRREGGAREDAFAIAGDDSFWFVSVADGAGSKPLAKLGAELATFAAAEAIASGHDQGAELTSLLELAARRALEALETESRARERDVNDLACTLLLALWRNTPEGEQLATFQIGDGSIATHDPTGVIKPLCRADESAFAGETHFLTGSHLRATWQSRFSLHSEVPAPGSLVVLMTDGVADDLIPLEKNGPVLRAELDRLEALPDAEVRLLQETLSYEKRGSFDDRTLVVVRRRSP